jgi:chemotaxis protein MotB
MPKKITALVLALLLAGCNTTDQATVSQTELERRIGDLEAELAQVRAERDSLRSQRSGWEVKLQQTARDLAAARTHNSDLQARLGDFQSEHSRRIAELQGKIDNYARQPVASFDIGPDWNSTENADGSVSFEAQSEVLFQPGSEVIGKRGEAALQRLHQLLAEQFPDHEIEIAGHTDSDPIRKSRNRFKNNMDLSLQRASEVYSYLLSHGLPSPDRVRAVGYGEFRPKKPNDTKENKRINRRVEVIVFPR